MFFFLVKYYSYARSKKVHIYIHGTMYSSPYADFLVCTHSRNNFAIP